jgi:AcrR family transcriptional regulator
MNIHSHARSRAEEGDMPVVGRDLERAEGIVPTRELILDAAEVCFAERGYEGTAMRELAMQVGLTPGALYNHFANKKALYEAVLGRGVQPIVDVLEGLERSDWSPERLDDLTDGLIAHLARRPHLSRLVLHEVLRGGENLEQLVSEWLRPLYERAIATFRRREYTGEWDEADLPRLAMSFHQLVMGYFAWAPLYEALTHESALAEQALAAQSQFLRKAVRLLILGRLPAGGHTER